MFVLGLETATERVSVAVGNSEGVSALFESTRGRRHAETVTPAIELVCREADIEIAEISAVAVDVGPGLFTGLRVGLAAGKALAQALDLPMIGFNSLELLAYPLRHSDAVIAAVMDGRKGQVFYSFFRTISGEAGHDTKQDIRAVSEPTAGSIEDFLIAVNERGQDVVCVGDGAVRFRDEISGSRFVSIADSFLAYPSASALVQRAQNKIRREDWVGYGDISALYLRRPDAEINWVTRSPQGVRA